MIFKQPTEKQLLEWQEIHRRFKDKLKPNKKSANEVLGYLINKYSLKELTNEEHLSVITDNILCSDFFAQKLGGKSPVVSAFLLLNEGNAKKLYDSQEDIWHGCEIFIGIDMISGYFYVEGSPLLYDEIYAFAGIDSYDIENYVRVADYINCIQKFNPEYYKSLLS